MKMTMRMGITCVAVLVGLAGVAEAAGPYQFYSVTPCRIVDTRALPGPVGGPALTNSQVRSFPIKGYCGVPSTAQAAVFNLTVVAPSNAGHLIVWPYGGAIPVVSFQNYVGGEPALANGAVIPLASDPSLHISAIGAVVGNVGTVHLVIDVTGYFAP